MQDLKVKKKQKLDANEALSLGREAANAHGNSFIFFTGDNGSGKSTLLSEIAQSFFRSNKKQDYVDWIDNQYGRPSKIIAYSMAPFSIFESHRFNMRIDREIYERIGSSNRSGRHSLLFQAIVEFCKSDLSKKYLFDEIANTAKISPSFRIQVRIDRYYINHLSGERRSQFLKNRATRAILESALPFTLLMEPGRLDIIETKSDRKLYDGSEEIADSLVQLRRIGALRILRVEYRFEDSVWSLSDTMSSGQLSLFVGLMVLASTITNNSIILIDEPEISLHPAWQEKYCQLLNSIVSFHRDCLVYVATHSPLVVNAASEMGAKIYNLGEQILQVADMPEAEPRDIEQIFALYFNTLTQNSYFVRETIVRAVQAYSEGDRKEFLNFQSTLRRIKSKVSERETKRLISEILKRSIQ